MIKQTINRILAVELDRKDFLKAVGIGVIATTGVAQALNSVAKQTSTAPKQKIDYGYGASTYGGRPSTNR